MFDELKQIMSGLTETEGTIPYVLEATGRPQFRNPYDDLVNGEIVPYHCYHSNGITSGYEWGRGTWDSTLKTITRSDANVDFSSNSNNRVNWAAGEKVFTVGVSERSMFQLAVLFANKDPWEVILQASSGQSNMGTANHSGRTHPTLVNSTRVYDLSTPGTATYDRADLAFRLVDHTQQAIYAGGLLPHVGVARSIQVDTVWTECTSIPFECARLLSELSGRIVCTVNVFKGNIQIDDSTGWGYDVGSGNCLDVWSEEIADVLNGTHTPPTGWTMPDAPDLVIFGQGENDAQASKDSGLYAIQAKDVIDDCVDSQRYGWAKEGNPWFWLEIPQARQEIDTGFSGHALLEEITPDFVKSVSSAGITTGDSFHYSKLGALNYGQRIALDIATPMGATKSGQGLSAAVDSADLNNHAFVYWVLRADSDTVPASDNGDFYMNVANTELYVTKTGGAGGAYPPDPLIPNLHRDGFVLTMTEGANSIAYTLDYLPEDNTNYWKWDVVSFEEAGTPTIGNNHVMTSDRKVPQGTAKIKSGALVALDKLSEANAATDQQGWTLESGPTVHGMAVADINGTLSRKGGVTHQYKRTSVTGNVTDEPLFDFIANETATHLWFKIRVFGQYLYTNNGDVVMSEFEGIGRRNVTAWVWDMTLAETIKLPAAPDGVVFDVAHIGNAVLEVQTTITGRSGEDWEFGVDAEIYEYEQVIV